MYRTLERISTSEFFEQARPARFLVIARSSDFVIREGELDPDDIGPYVWRQSYLRHSSLILSPPDQPAELPPMLPNLGIYGASWWGLLMRSYAYVCPSFAITAIYRECWNSELFRHVIVLHDWALMRHPRFGSLTKAHLR